MLSFFIILVVVASSSVEAEGLLRGSADDHPDSFGSDLVPN
jgi:hypothetical protein